MISIPTTSEDNTRGDPASIARADLLAMQQYDPRDPRNASIEAMRNAGMRAMSEDELRQRSIDQAPLMRNACPMALSETKFEEEPKKVSRLKRILNLFFG